MGNCSYVRDNWPARGMKAKRVTIVGARGCVASFPTHSINGSHKQLSALQLLSYFLMFLKFDLLQVDEQYQRYMTRQAYWRAGPRLLLPMVFACMLCMQYYLNWKCDLIRYHCREFACLWTLNLLSAWSHVSLLCNKFGDLLIGVHCIGKNIYFAFADHRFIGFTIQFVSQLKWKRVQRHLSYNLNPRKVRKVNSKYLKAQRQRKGQILSIQRLLFIWSSHNHWNITVFTTAS